MLSSPWQVSLGVQVQLSTCVSFAESAHPFAVRDKPRDLLYQVMI
jgi:hypothetical protein